MKTKFKLSAFLTFALVLVFALCSCQSTVSYTAPAYDENGKYLGFSNIPEGYDADAAIRDGCLVIDTIKTGENKGGLPIRETKTAEGYDNWLEFFENSHKGKDGFLRVAHFIEGVGYYTDLYCTNGKYTIFELNEYGVSQGKSFNYLRRLDGNFGEKEDSLYVLTDSLELTYGDVRWSMFASDFSNVTKIPFKWLGFMIYFD